MSAFLDEIKVNTAVDSRSKLDLSHQHITTANFMQFNPIMCKEMVPGEKVDVDLMTFSRMQPLAVPTFGRANIKERAFFVPMRTIFRGWNDFITDTPHVFSDGSGSQLVQTVPTITNELFVEFFCKTNVVLSGTNYVVTTSGSAASYDICGYYNGQMVYRKLTQEGRQCLKMIESLGYKIVWTENCGDYYSALPLLALVKIYLDWYFPSAYANYGSYIYLQAMLNYDKASPLQLVLSDLQRICGWLTYVNFDSDYFTSAWDNPAAPNVGVYSQFNIVDVTTLHSGLGTGGHYPWGTSSTTFADVFSANNSLTSNGTPVVGQNMYSNNTEITGKIGQSVSTFQHQALKSLTDYLKRHQLVGARALDRYLARFGVALSPEKMNRCNYISTTMVPLQIGDVMSSADTSGSGETSNLASFAGKGMAFNKNFSFNWRTDEYGYLIVISSIVPGAGMWQGLDRKVMHTSKLSFWTPEFDNLGVQAISMRELYNNYSYQNLANNGTTYMQFDDTVFGFAPRYGEYKYMNDQLTGDFNVMTLNNNMQSASNAWHLMRTFDDSDFSYGGVYNYGNMAHSVNFLQGLRDHEQFNRIFMYTDKEGNQPDPFTMIYDFKMVSLAPMKPLYDTYEFDDKGPKVKEEANGVKMN